MKFGPFKITVEGRSRAGKSTVQGIIARALADAGGKITCYDAASGLGAAKVNPKPPLPTKWALRPFPRENRVVGYFE